MVQNFDLLGDPIPDNHGKPGANGHIATAENINRVRLLLIAGKNAKEIAGELGISQPTLSKHYFSAGHKTIEKARAKAIADQQAKNLLRLDKAAEKGNVAAIKEQNALLTQESMRDRARAAAGAASGDAPAAKPKPMARGKKEQRVDAAQSLLEENPLLDPTRLN